MKPATATPGPYLVRFRPLEENEVAQPIVSVRRRFRLASQPHWKVAFLAAAAGVLLTAAVMIALDPRSAMPPPPPAPRVVVAPSQERSDFEATGAFVNQNLISRNRRLEALVEVLRERRKAKPVKSQALPQSGN